VKRLADDVIWTPSEHQLVPLGNIGAIYAVSGIQKHPKADSGAKKASGCNFGTII
jgi:hypothetical protein